ncbi:MAG: phosphohistidine phosphatase, partial [Mycobacterium sp.]|nr:phosphohistidine phosphatase [Mycobacterium sp.]
EVKTLLVIGHEPATSELAIGLTADGDQAALEQMVLKYPTSAIAMLRTAEPWDRLVRHGATLVTFHVPR